MSGNFGGECLNTKISLPTAAADAAADAVCAIQTIQAKHKLLLLYYIYIINNTIFYFILFKCTSGKLVIYFGIGMYMLRIMLELRVSLRLH